MGFFGVSAWDINVNSKLTDVPNASGLHFAVRLNDAGDFGFDMDLSDPQSAKVVQTLLDLSGNPFKVCVTANNDQLILFTGIVWQPSMKSSSSLVSFAGKALTSYFQEITIATSYTTSINPGQLICNAVTDAQASGPGTNRGITPVLAGTSFPPNVTPNYQFNQYTTVAQVIADQTAAVTPGTGGVDYFMSDAFVSGVPSHTMYVVGPRAGRNSSASNLSVNLAKCIEWTWPTDNLQSGNHVIAVGSSTGGVQAVATADDTAPRGGLGQPPRLDLVLQYSNVSNSAQLQAIANGSVQQFGKPISTPTATITIDHPGCALGTFQIGDDVRVWSEPSIWFPRGKSEWWRIVAYEVKVPDEGLPQVTLTFNRPPVF